MDEKTEKLLRELAEKLGTTVEHLWGVLTKQAVIEAYMGLVTIGGKLGVLLLSITVLLYYRKKPQLYFSGSHGETPTVKGIVSIVFGVIGGLTLLILVMTYTRDLLDVLTGLSNPEYYALKEVGKLF